MSPSPLDPEESLLVQVFRVPLFPESRNEEDRVHGASLDSAGQRLTSPCFLSLICQMGIMSSLTILKHLSEGEAR